MRLGLREANQRFSQAVRAVKAGEEVVLTERGRPIAVIKPLAPQDPDHTLRRLAGCWSIASGCAPRAHAPVETS